MSEAKINTNDLERLKDHVRFIKGLRTDGRNPVVRRPSTKNSITPKLNKTYAIRKECIKKRMGNWDSFQSTETSEVQKMHDLNLKRKRAEYFKLNKAFHMRWKNIRGLPVVHSHFRNAYLDTGKPPFVVPVHYEPFNVYWDADWAKQEFIFLDAAAEEKKKGDQNHKDEEKKRKEAEEKKRKETEEKKRKETEEKKRSTQMFSSGGQKTKGSSQVKGGTSITETASESRLSSAG